MITRRSFIRRAATLLAAPAIVKASSLMNVSVWTPPVAKLQASHDGLLWFDVGDMVELVDNNGVRTVLTVTHIASNGDGSVAVGTRRPYKLGDLTVDTFEFNLPEILRG